MKQDLTQRIHQVLTDLRYMSEAQAAKGADSSPKLSSQHPGGNPPPGQGHGEYDYHLGKIERAVKNAEEARDTLKRRVKQEAETREQFRHRVLSDYEGSAAQHAADKESVSPALIYKIRAEDGRTAKDGRKV